MFQCFSVSMFQCFNVSMFQCFNVSTSQWFNVSMFQCFNGSMFHGLAPDIDVSRARWLDGTRSGTWRQKGGPGGATRNYGHIFSNDFSFVDHFIQFYSSGPATAGGTQWVAATQTASKRSECSR